MSGSFINVLEALHALEIDIYDIGTPQPDQDLDAYLPVKSQYDVYNYRGVIFIMRHMAVS